MQVRSEREVLQVGDALVTVRKAALDLGRENVVGIKLAIASAADRPVAVQVTEEFPGHVSMSDVQVHPKYSPGKWSISEQLHRMVFEDELAPGTEVETVYGVRVTDGNLEPFLGEPRLAVAEAGGGGRTGETLDDVIPREAELGSTEATDGDQAAGPATGAASVTGGQTNGPATGAASVTGGQTEGPATGGASVTGGQTEGPATGGASVSGAQPVATEAGAAGPSSDIGGDQPDDPESLEELFQYGEARAGSNQASEVPRPSAGSTGAAGPVSEGRDRVQAIAQELAGRELTDQQLSTLRSALDLGPGRSTAAADGLASAVARLESLVQRLERALDAGAARSPTAHQQPVDSPQSGGRPSAEGSGATVDDPTGGGAAEAADDRPQEERTPDDEVEDPPSRLALLDPEAAQRRGDGGIGGPSGGGPESGGTASNGQGSAASDGAADASAAGGPGDAQTEAASEEDPGSLESLFADSGD